MRQITLKVSEVLKNMLFIVVPKERGEEHGRIIFVSTNFDLSQ